MEPAIYGLIGAAVGALASLLGSVLANLIAVRSQTRQFELQQQSAKSEWIRDRLQETYSQCFYNLAKLHQHALASQQPGRLTDEERHAMFGDYAETMRWVYLLFTYHPATRTGKVDNAFSDIIAAVESFSVDVAPKAEKVRLLRAHVLSLAATDERLLRVLPT